MKVVKILSESTKRKEALKELAGSIEEFIFPDGTSMYYAFEYGDEDAGTQDKLYAGKRTPNGVTHDYEMIYDWGKDVGSNLQDFYDDIIKKNKMLGIPTTDNITENYKPVYTKSLTESLDERTPLNGARSNLFELPNGDNIYVGYSKGKLFGGCATNTGIMHEYEMDYDWNNSVDGNLQNFYDYITSKLSLTESLDDYDGEIDLFGDPMFDEDLTEDVSMNDLTHKEWQLYVYIINNGDLYHKSILPTIRNIRRKLDKGVYQEDLAIKAFEYVVVAGLRKYRSESDDRVEDYSAEEKQNIAKQLLARYQEEINE